jgi:hypothetical protein
MQLFSIFISKQEKRNENKTFNFQTSRNYTFNWILILYETVTAIIIAIGPLYVFLNYFSVPYIDTHTFVYIRLCYNFFSFSLCSVDKYENTPAKQTQIFWPPHLTGLSELHNSLSRRVRHVRQVRRVRQVRQVGQVGQVRHVRQVRRVRQVRQVRQVRRVRHVRRVRLAFRLFW